MVYEKTVLLVILHAVAIGAVLLTTLRYKYIPLRKRSKKGLGLQLALVYINGMCILFTDDMTFFDSAGRKHCLLAYLSRTTLSFALAFFFVARIIELYLKNLKQKIVQSQKKSFKKLELLIKYHHFGYIGILALYLVYPLTKCIGEYKGEQSTCIKEAQYEYSVMLVLALTQLLFCLLLREKPDMFYYRVENYISSFLLILGIIFSFVLDLNRLFFFARVFSFIISIGYVASSHFLLGFLTFKSSNVISNHWQEIFDLFMINESLLNQFADYLKKELCSENLEFLKQVHEFKNAFYRDQEEALLMAKTIFMRFVQHDSLYKINLCPQTRKKIAKKMKRKIKKNLFIEGVAEIQNFLVTGPFIRFFNLYHNDYVLPQRKSKD